MKIFNIAVLLAVLVLFGTCAYGADCNGGGRYEINRVFNGASFDSTGTVTDCRTGLVWLQNANCKQASNGITPDTEGTLTWKNAMKWSAGLGHGTCGLNDGSGPGDWRLPTKTEWMAMIQNAINQHITPPL
jgi:hypothetical protein